MLTAAIVDIPDAPTTLGALLVVGVLLYYLLRDRSAFMTQSQEISGLRKALDDQAERHRRDMAEVNEKVARMDARLEEARTERHYLRGELGKRDLALALVRQLSADCTCGALSPLGSVLDHIGRDE